MKHIRSIAILACLAVTIGLCACATEETTVPSDVRVGDTVAFGRYEQDGDRFNGKEPITWRVLEVSGGKALLLSDRNLDAKPFSTAETGLTWATSTLRAWLNEDFLKAAFTASEASAIVQTTLANPDNPTYGTKGGDTTDDRVFLLSMEEARLHFPTDESRIGLNTAHAVSRGADDKDGAGWWWLRSPGLFRFAACVSRDGSLFEGGRSVTDSGSAVRPAIRVTLAS